MSIHRSFLLAGLVLFASYVSILIPVGVAHAAVISEHGAWVAAKEKEKGYRVCLISSKPQKSMGKYTRRGTVNAIVSHRPAEGRIGEVSIQAGYTYKRGSLVTLSINGGKLFQLFTQGGYAWTRDVADDHKLVRAMRAGMTMTVKGTSSRGTRTTDIYSLKGFSAAMNAINRACGVK